MNKKGQVFLLDLLAALVIVVLATGVLVQMFEIITYAEQDRNVISNLEDATIMVSDSLVLSSTTTCELKKSDGQTIEYLVNCLDTSKLVGVTKEELGIPDWVGCHIKYGSHVITDCGTLPPPNAKNSVTVHRTVVLSGGDISKADFDSCVTNGSGCSNIFSDVNAEITLWEVAG